MGNFFRMISCAAMSLVVSLSGVQSASSVDNYGSQYRKVNLSSKSANFNVGPIFDVGIRDKTFALGHLGSGNTEFFEYKGNEFKKITSSNLTNDEFQAQDGAIYNKNFYFACRVKNIGEELCKFDGIRTSVVRDFRPRIRISTIGGPKLFASTTKSLYFSYFYSEDNTTVLYHFDGRWNEAARLPNSVITGLTIAGLRVYYTVRELGASRSGAVLHKLGHPNGPSNPIADDADVIDTVNNQMVYVDVSGKINVHQGNVTRTSPESFEYVYENNYWKSGSLLKYGDKILVVSNNRLKLLDIQDFSTTDVISFDTIGAAPVWPGHGFWISNSEILMSLWDGSKHKVYAWNLLSGYREVFTSLVGTYENDYALGGALIGSDSFLESEDHPVERLVPQKIYKQSATANFQISRKTFSLTAGQVLSLGVFKQKNDLAKSATCSVEIYSKDTVVTKTASVSRAEAICETLKVGNSNLNVEVLQIPLAKKPQKTFSVKVAIVNP